MPRNPHERIAPAAVGDEAGEMQPRGNTGGEHAERLVLGAELAPQLDERIEVLRGGAAERIDRDHLLRQRAHELHMLVTEDAKIGELARQQRRQPEHVAAAGGMVCIEYDRAIADLEIFQASVLVTDVQRLGERGEPVVASAGLDLGDDVVQSVKPSIRWAAAAQAGVSSPRLSACARTPSAASCGRCRRPGQENGPPRRTGRRERQGRSHLVCRLGTWHGFQVRLMWRDPAGRATPKL